MPAWNRRTPALLVALTPILCAAGTAQDHKPDGPLRLPSSDVVVTYQLGNVPDYGPHKLQVSYTHGGERVRLDFYRWMEAKVPFQSVIFDRPQNRRVTLHPESKTFTEDPAGDVNPGILLRADAVVSRQGSAVVAHAPCTEWQIESPDKDAGNTACITDDGILLRLVSSKPSVASLLATNINYSTAPDSIFVPPQGFRH